MAIDPVTVLLDIDITDAATYSVVLADAAVTGLSVSEAATNIVITDVSRTSPYEIRPLEYTDDTEVVYTDGKSFVLVWWP